MPDLVGHAAPIGRDGWVNVPSRLFQAMAESLARSPSSGEGPRPGAVAQPTQFSADTVVALLREQTVAALPDVMAALGPRVSKRTAFRKLKWTQGGWPASREPRGPRRGRGA